MNATLELILRILALGIAAAGILMVYAAPKIVDRKGLAERKTVDPKLVDHLSPEEQQKYKRDAAILDIKLRGLLIASPGLILILIAFR